MRNNLHEQPLPRAALEALERGNKIEAIKIVRAEMRIGLKEAKDLVDAKNVAPSKASIKSPLMTGEASRSGAPVWRWLIGLALAIGAWYWLR
jgi:hypothetical protein